MNGTPCSTQLIFAGTQLEKAQAEIEALRQQVKEKDTHIQELINWQADAMAGEPVPLSEGQKMEAELAALKQGQGEPYLYFDPDTFAISREKPLRPTYIELYTSAPTIPAGWLQRGKAELENLRNSEDLCCDDELLERLLNAMLAALKQQGEPVLYQCTKCGGANYGCQCESLSGCTEPLYAAPQTCFSAADMADQGAKAAQLEREECAKVCEATQYPNRCDRHIAHKCADAIRMRGDKKGES